MSIKRRIILKGTFVGGAIVASGLLNTRIAVAAWPENTFNKTNLNDAMDSLGVTDLSITNDITIKAPDLAEHGALVPVSITSSIPDIDKISILVEKNPQPLVATFELSNQCRGYVSTRIKMKNESNIIAIVQAGGKYYSNRKVVNIAIGGCDE